MSKVDDGQQGLLDLEPAGNRRNDVLLQAIRLIRDHRDDESTPGQALFPLSDGSRTSDHAARTSRAVSNGIPASIITRGADQIVIGIFGVGRWSRGRGPTRVAPLAGAPPSPARARGVPRSGHRSYRSGSLGHRSRSRRGCSRDRPPDQPRTGTRRGDHAPFRTVGAPVTRGAAPKTPCARAAGCRAVPGGEAVKASASEVRRNTPGLTRQTP